MSPNYASTHARRILLALALGFLPSVSHADTTCDVLLGGLRQFTKVKPAKNYIRVFWTTNYNGGNGRFMGSTEIALRIRGEILQDLVGTGMRSRKFDRPLVGPAAVEGDEGVSLRIQLDGKVTFNDQYGPYDPTCPGSSIWTSRNAFAVIHTGDSVEVFNFRIAVDP